MKHKGSSILRPAEVMTSVEYLRKQRRYLQLQQIDHHSGARPVYWLNEA
jgi:hypothetical protein